MAAISWARQHELLLTKNYLTAAIAEDLTCNRIGLYLDSDLLYTVLPPQGD